MIDMVFLQPKSFGIMTQPLQSGTSLVSEFRGSGAPPSKGIPAAPRAQCLRAGTKGKTCTSLMPDLRVQPTTASPSTPRSPPGDQADRCRLFCLFLAHVACTVWHHGHLAEVVKTFARRVAADRGEYFVDLAGATIRNISRGVIGVALLQALPAGLILTVFGVPAAGVMAFVLLIFCIVQVGPVPVVLPVIIWAWSTKDTGPALLFTLLLLVIPVIDNVLKPILMARGASHAMLPRLRTRRVGQALGCMTAVGVGEAQTGPCRHGHSNGRIAGGRSNRPHDFCACVSSRRCRLHSAVRCDATRPPR